MSPPSQQRGTNIEPHKGAVRPPVSAYSHSHVAMASSNPYPHHGGDALGLMSAYPSAEVQPMQQEKWRKQKQAKMAQYPPSESSVGLHTATPRYVAAHQDISPHLQTPPARDPASQGSRNNQQLPFKSAQTHYNVGSGSDQTQPGNFLSLSSSSSNPSDDYRTLQDNPLVANIDQDIEDVACEVRKMTAPPLTAQHSLELDQHPLHHQLIQGDQGFEIPLDPNLVCSKCGRKFRHGEIQKLRKHFDKCSGKQ